MKHTFTLALAVTFLMTLCGATMAQDSLKNRPAPNTSTKAAVQRNTQQANRQTASAKPAVAAMPLVAGSLNAQYDDLLRKSWSQQGYKVINQVRLNTFWKNVQDSLRSEKSKRNDLQTKLSRQTAEIADLKEESSTHQANLEKSSAAINEVSLLGIPVDKTTYNTIMWGIVIALALALGIVIFTAGKSIREARYRRQLFDELSAEYQTYKVKANDKEKKLARELQTERNRVEELLNKG